MLRKPATWHRRHDLRWLAAFVLPALVIVVAVQFYPLAYSAVLSVQEWSLTKSQEPQGFVGLDNFAEELGDSTFQRSVRNSILITGGAVILEMFLGVCLAYLTMGSSWRMRAVRTLLILPMVIAPVAAGTLWRILLNSRAGLVNHLLSFIGVKGPEWLASPDWAIVSVILLDTWQWTPFVLLVAGAAIASIPEDLLEVASIDGGLALADVCVCRIAAVDAAAAADLGIPHVGIAAVAGFDLFADFRRSGIQHIYNDLLHLYAGIAQFQLRRGGRVIVDIHGFCQFFHRAGFLVSAQGLVALQ